MTTPLYEIITALQQESSSNAKLDILQANKDNALLKEYMRVTHSPQINFYVSEKTFPIADAGTTPCLALDTATIGYAIHNYALRNSTGHDALRDITKNLRWLSKEDGELFKMMLLKDIKAGIGAKQINKVWPDLIPVQPYMRCSLPSDVDTSKWDWESGVYSQVKADGMYCAISNNKAITRNGNCFDIKSFDKCLQKDILDIPDGCELNGELVIHLVDGSMLDRKTSNGLLNSLLKSGEPLDSKYKLYYDIWDYQRSGEQSHPYSERFRALLEFYSDQTQSIRVIETHICHNSGQSQQHLKQCLALGLEGTVLKNPKGLWKDGTSKDIVKNKIVADIELLCYDVYEGSGKAKGKLGGLSLRSEDGIVQVNCGTGFTDKQREEYWKHPPIGCIIHITANDLVQEKKKNSFSLFLPSFQEIRTDKNEADDFQKIKAIINNAKGIA
jgi:DNA ligase-1